MMMSLNHCGFFFFLLLEMEPRRTLHWAALSAMWLRFEVVMRFRCVQGTLVHRVHAESFWRETSRNLQLTTTGRYGRKQVSVCKGAVRMDDQTEESSWEITGNNWTGSFNFPMCFKYFYFLFSFWKLCSYTAFGISQILSLCPNFSVTIRINLLDCIYVCKPAHIFTSRRIDPNKQNS